LVGHNKKGGGRRSVIKEIARVNKFERQTVVATKGQLV
jgi:hypothetical protein